MRRRVEATAPGKLMLSGEYAVLEGAPAVVMAVNRRARVSIEAADDDSHSVVAPGYRDAPSRFRFDAGGCTWEDGHAAFGLFESVLVAAGVQIDTPCRFTLDTREFIDMTSGRKLGLGSSAALAAALSMALAELTSGDEHPMVAAAGGHQAFQGGRGSGADVAASVAGGLIEYRMREAGWALLDWPEGLVLRCFFSGTPSDTPSRIARFEQSGEHPARASLREASERSAEVWRSGHARRILAELGRYVKALRDFSTALDLDIFAAGHDVLVDAAAELDVVYKPSGAGGGDAGIVLGDDPASLDVFASVAASQGFAAVDLRLDPLGARVSQ